MNTLPTKPEAPQSTPVEVEEVPTWKELADRFRDLMKDIGAELSETWKEEGKDIGREAETRALSALKRTRIEIEKLIDRLEERIAKRAAARNAKQTAEADKPEG
jgi:hypothetical protein